MEKKDPPVFSKKEKIIIISIFAVLFLASIIVTIYLVYKGYPKNFQWFNFFPVFFIVLAILNVMLAYVFRHKGGSVFGLFIFKNNQRFTYDAKYLKNKNIESLIYLIQIFFQIPLIFYIQTIRQVTLSLAVFWIPFFIQALLPFKKVDSEKIEREKTKNLQKRFGDNMYK